MERELRIAIYMRLSKEDENMEEESGSIRTQRILLRNFADEHFEGYRLYEFQDDGYSGTNLNRPGVSEMLEMVRESALDCIIVKDFSRFSRDYIVLGSYLEQIFPFMGIRFISVNDHYDSDNYCGRAGELDFCFRNLMYDLYSKDLSVKVKSSLETGKARGYYISANCPFGYEKAPEDRHMLVIAEDEAEIVRRIFDMTRKGMTSARIAGILNAEGVKTPAEFKREKGKRRREGNKGASWGSSTVCAILRNEVYTGDMVYGKTWKEEVGGRNRPRPRSEWKVFRNHHVPIVSREVFEEVRKGRSRKRRPDKGERHPLSGRLVCSGCGKKLYIRQGREPYFCCSGWYVNHGKECVKRLNAKWMERYVLDAIRQRVDRLADIDKLWEKRTILLTEHREALRTEKRKLTAGLDALKREKMKHYEHYIEKREEGEMEKAAEDYRRCLQEISVREKELERLLSQNGQKAKALEARLSKKQDREELLECYGLNELTRDTVQRLIHKIVVRDEGHSEIFWDEDAAVI